MKATQTAIAANQLAVIHPLAIGARITSINGESDTDDDDISERHTGPNAVGQVVSADLYPRQGWTYGVVFANGTWVHIDEDELKDAACYRVHCQAEAAHG